LEQKKRVFLISLDSNDNIIHTISNLQIFTTHRKTSGAKLLSITTTSDFEIRSINWEEKKVSLIKSSTLIPKRAMLKSQTEFVSSPVNKARVKNKNS
jgi:hypothetical protein